MSVSINDIDRNGVYTLREAAKLLPSSQAGKQVHPRTLDRWIAQGSLKAFKRGKSWFIHGSELLRFLEADRVEEWQGRTPSQRSREIAEAEAELKRMGVL